MKLTRRGFVGAFVATIGSVFAMRGKAVTIDEQKPEHSGGDLPYADGYGLEEFPPDCVLVFNADGVLRWHPVSESEEEISRVAAYAEPEE